MQKINLEYAGDMEQSIVEKHTLQEFCEFDDLCPNWAENISRAGGFSNCDKSFDTYSITECDRCVVGEAHS